MSETVIKKSKPHFLELYDVTGDKLAINLDNVNALWVDVDTIKVLFANDPNEHKFNGFSKETLDEVNRKRF